MKNIFFYQADFFNLRVQTKYATKQQRKLNQVNNAAFDPFMPFLISHGIQNRTPSDIFYLMFFNKLSYYQTIVTKN